jgi:putative peptidoglycan lipid II flippase
MSKARIGVAGAIWSASLLASRVIGLVRERVLGATLGVGSEADIYQAAFRIPDIVNMLIAGGALSIVFIPIFTTQLERQDEARAWRSFSIIANFIVLLLGLLILLAWLAMPALSPQLAPGFSPEQHEKLTHLTRIVLPAQLFHVVGGLLGATLLSKDKHAVPALAPLLYTGAAIAGGLLLGNSEGFAWGILIGAILGPFGLPFLACLKEGLKWSWGMDLKDSDFKLYLFRSLPIMFAFSIIGWDDTVQTWVGSSLGEGKIAILGYSKTLMKVPMGVFGTAMGIAAYPTLSRLCAEGKHEEAWKTICQSGRQVLVLAVGSGVVLTVAGAEVGELVYSKKRIAEENFQALGSCLGLFCAALPAWSIQPVLARGFYARGKTWLPTWIGCGVLLLFLPVYLGLSKIYGIYGLAAASSLAICTYALLLGGKLYQEIGHGQSGGLLSTLARLGLAAACGLGVGGLVDFEGVAWLKVAVLGGVAGLVFVGGAWLLGVEELKSLVGKIRSRIFRR